MAHWWEECSPPLSEGEVNGELARALVTVRGPLRPEEPYRKTGKRTRAYRDRFVTVPVFRIRAGREYVFSSPHLDYMRALDGLRDGFSTRLGDGPVTGLVVFK